MSGTDYGIWRRIKVLPWTTQFRGRTEDRQLAEKLATEGPGILNWLIEGVNKWQHIGLSDETVPASVRAATEAYRKAKDDVSRWLEDSELALVDHLSTQASELIKSWKNWSEANRGQASRFNEVAQALERMGCERNQYDSRGPDGKRTRIKIWKGVGRAI